MQTCDRLPYIKKENMVYNILIMWWSLADGGCPVKVIYQDMEAKSERGAMSLVKLPCFAGA